jgi:isoleucyl-tRNA synthetase
VDEWFVNMDELRPLMMDITRQIRWIPPFGLERELDWLKNMHDWMISKKRYWGLALPIWECDSCDAWTVVGDDVELKERAVAGYEEFAGHTPHRPWIDSVKLECEQCGGQMTRIADVGNPWLDAGIVSFSTLRYRQDREYWRKWYPADWISESFPGQFRNWFYSMLVMGAIVDKSPSFVCNFGYATLLAEDGRPMHKSWGNAIEFNEAADKMGVDVMRWMYCNHKPEQNLLFGYHRADEVRRQFLIPLWNVYNFFVTYAKLDGWEPIGNGQGTTGDGGPETGVNSLRSPVSGLRSLLDRWILARLNEVIAKVTVSLENYDAYMATNAIEALLEDLTNWYVRRSRRRFWRSEHDADKEAAYATLYQVLTTLIKMLAPFTPFVTEVMYQNLVCGVDSNAPESVHHYSWPEADEAAIDQALLDQMALARQIASLGLGARGSANIKVRQPLARALVHIGQAVSLSPELTAIVVDELNVKSLEFVAEAGELVTYKVLPNLKLLGPKLGKQLPAVRQALEAADPAELAAKVQAGETITLGEYVNVVIESQPITESQPIELIPEELLIQTQPAEGLAVAADKVITVGVDVVITDELAAEGLARELVRRIHNMRKDAGFDTLDKLRAASGVKIGGQSVGFSTYNEGRLFVYMLGLKDALFIAAFGGAELDPAMMRGEIDGRATGPDTILQRNRDWLDKGLVNIHAIMETPKGDKHPMPVFAKLPEVETFAKNDKERRMLALQRGFRVTGTPFVLPPGTPKDRVDILKEAFRKTYLDPEFAKYYLKLSGDEPTPLLPENHEKAIREVPRDPEAIELFKIIAGPKKLPPR